MGIKSSAPDLKSLYNLLSSDQQMSFSISETANNYHDKIDQSPDAASSKCQQLNNPDTGMACIEPVNSKHTEEEA